MAQENLRELLAQLKKSEEGNSLQYAAEVELIHARVSDVRPQSIVSDAIALAARENEAVAVGHVLRVRHRHSIRELQVLVPLVWNLRHRPDDNTVVPPP